MSKKSCVLTVLKTVWGNKNSDLIDYLEEYGVNFTESNYSYGVDIDKKPLYLSFFFRKLDKSIKLVNTAVSFSSVFNESEIINSSLIANEIKLFEDALINEAKKIGVNIYPYQEVDDEGIYSDFYIDGIIEYFTVEKLDAVIKLFNEYEIGTKKVIDKHYKNKRML